MKQSVPQCVVGTLHSRRLLHQRLHVPVRERFIPPNKKSTCHCKCFLFGGRGWIRTTEAESSRFTVCPLWPLGNSPILNLAVTSSKKWSWWTDSNPRPADYKSAALPTELHQHQSRRQDSNLRHLGPKPSTLPN